MGPNSQTDIVHKVHEIIRRFARGIDLPEYLPDDLLLTEDGLGFDSVKIVELLFVCEEELGVTMENELSEDAAIDVGTLVGLFCTKAEV